MFGVKVNFFVPLNSEIVEEIEQNYERASQITRGEPIDVTLY